MIDPQTRSSTVPHAIPRAYGIAAVVAAVVLAGLWLVARFNDADLARDMQGWQEKLGLIAESRASEVSRWVQGNLADLQTLADNPSLQLYMTELQMKKKPGLGDELAQTTYLRNLLLFTAQRSGFGQGRDTPSIPADLPPESKSGLAIFDSSRKLVVSTPMQADARNMLFNYAARFSGAQAGLIDIRKDNDGTPMIGFIVPVFSIQGDQTAGEQIGCIIGIKPVGDTLFGLLNYPGTTEKTLESILLRASGNNIEYLSPLLDKTEALGKQAPLDPTRSAESALIKAPGNFIADEKDYRGQRVLATSRAVAGTPWILVTKIDRREALAGSEERRAGMVTFFFLIIAAIALIIIAVWWHAHSRRSLLLSEHFRNVAARAEAQERLLSLVTDHQPESVFIVDSQWVVRFANRMAAEEATMREEAMPGKALSDVRGAARAGHTARQCDKALKEGHIVYDVQRLPQPGAERIIRSAYVPLEHIPVAELAEPTPGVLVVEQDISEVVLEREQRLKTQRQLVDLLIWMVDKRDPFAANHSQLVAKIAQEIAFGMGLDETAAETAKTAASLMNIGKIVVPPELLTKTGSLSAEEREIVHDSMNAAAGLLEGIAFDGPVAEALRQWQEKWDGSGPLGLKGDSILIEARIIAVANTFIGMISPRSWRTAMTIEAAAKFLLDKADRHFDKRVVIALVNYIENKNGSAWLKATLERQQKAA